MPRKAKPNRLLFRLAKAIAVAPQADSLAAGQAANHAAYPATNQAAFDAADAVLAAGDLLCIFPEGSIARDGRLLPFQGGLMAILQRRAVPVVPVALQNLRGSAFWPSDGSATQVSPLRRSAFSPVRLAVGPALPPEGVTPAGLQQRVQRLLDGAPRGTAAGSTVRPLVR